MLCHTIIFSSYLLQPISFPALTSTPAACPGPTTPCIAHLPGTPTPAPSSVSAVIAPTPAPTPSIVATPTPASPAIIASATTAAPATTIVAPTPVASRASVAADTVFPFFCALLFLVQHIDLVAQGTLPGLQQIQILKLAPGGHLPQTGCADAVFCEQVVDEGVDVCEGEVFLQAAFYFAVVGEEGLEGGVDFHGLPGEADVEGGEAAQVFEGA